MVYPNQAHFRALGMPDLDFVDGVEVGHKLEALIEVLLHAVSGVGRDERLGVGVVHIVGQLLHKAYGSHRASSIQAHKLQTPATEPTIRSIR